MKKTLPLLVLALVLAVSGYLAPSAKAADDASFRVRVNGRLVDFPDAQPIVDDHQRTLAPIRFVTEQLGADVSWVQKTQTAVIARNGTTVEITIGSPTLRVTKNGESSAVVMDTAAVGRDGRTYVPIRFVAEALGAYVDWSQRHRVVGVYQGELTPAQISALQYFDKTFDSTTISSIDGHLMFTANSGSWADMREDLYAQKKAPKNSLAKSVHYFLDLKKSLPSETSAEYCANLIQNAKAAIEYHSDNLDVTFAADPSCIYQQLDNYSSTLSVRGYVTVTPKINVNDMTGGERWLLISLLSMHRTVLGETYTFPIDAHVIDLADGAQLHEVWNFETGELGN